MTEPTFVLIKRKLVYAWVASYLTIVVMCIIAVQWASYVDRRSNQRLCGLVVIFDDANQTSPPVAEFQTRVALEFRKLRQEFNCK